MSASLTCPPNEQLREFALGVISEVEATAIADHLDQCVDCEQTVDSLELSGDTVVNAILRPKAVDPYAEEPGCRRVEALVLEIGQDVSSRTLLGLNAAAAEFPPREQLGPYQLSSRIGAGGMGAVYRAVHTKLDKVVALKILPAERTQDPLAVSRFAREMRAVGKLDHPHLVRATDAGEIDGTHFLVMELVDGLDLSTIVKRRGPLPIAEACEAIRQAALGLQEAHRHGMVHRDIKPSNLMLARSPRPEEPPVVKILDLGLALLTNDIVTADAEITSADQVVGTVDYLPPEQLADTHHVDIRADIYSLGATLYKLLTGEPPFPTSQYRTNMLKLAAIVHDAIRPAETLRPEIPSALAAVVAQMLSRSASERYAVPADVAQALKPFCGGANLALLLEPSGTEGDVLAAASVDTSRGLPQAELVRRPAGLRPFVRSALIGAALAAFFAVIVITITRPDGTKTTVEAEGDPRIKIGPETIEIEPGTSPVASPPAVPVVPANFSLEFDGKSSYVALPTLKLDHSRPLTMEATIVPESDQTGAVIGNGRIALHFPVVSGLGDPRQGRLVVGSRTAGFTDALSTWPNRPGTVLRVAGVLDGTTARLYVNGKLQSAVPMKTPIDPTNFFPLIGADPPRENPSARFTGQIDELRISRSARYAAEYEPQARLEADAETLALYHFDDGKGDVLTDASGNGHHGKIYHGKWAAGIVDRTEPANSQGKSANEANRRAVAWVLGVGGNVTLVQGKRTQSVSSANELPTTDYGLELSLYKNAKVDDAGLKNLRGATAVTSLRLEGTKITQLSPLETLPRLESLSLASRQIDASDLELLQQIPSLRKLSFGDREIPGSGQTATDAALESICRLTQLTELNFGTNESPLTDAGVQQLRRLPQLKSLILSAPAVTDKGLAVLADLPQLQSLNLSEMNLGGRDFSPLANLSRLESLTLWSNQLTDDDLMALPTLTELSHLQLIYCHRLTGVGLGELKRYPRLKHLSLHGSGITDAGLNVLVEALPQLSYLSLSDAKGVSNEGLTSLQAMSSLGTLSLINCKQLTDEAAPVIANIPLLTRAYLSRSGMTQAGIAELRRLKPNLLITE